MPLPQVPFIGKLLPPRQNAEVIQRQRLLDILHTSFDRKLVTIAAPAGYGKTTLAASFALDAEVPTCWYHLDESDQQPGQFLEYLIASLQRCYPHVGEQTLAALHGASGNTPQYSQLIGTLVTEIYAGVPEYFLLVFDDFHTVEDSQPIVRALDLFLTSVPDNCHVLLLSRTPPKLPALPRMVANRQAARLTAKDLAFTDEEAARFLALLGIETSREELETLVKQCEGWIAGIALAVLGGRAPVPPDLKNKPGGDQEWFDYVVAEIYQRLPEATRTFLRRSSILYELRPTHCNAIFAIKNAGALLRSLSESLQLVTRLEGEDLYRYHNLFHSFLARLAREDEGEYLRLHRKAGRYFAEQRLWEAAIFHLCQARSFDAAAEVVGRAAGEIYEAGQWSRLAGWIDRLPQATLDRRPFLLIARARTAAQMGEGERGMQLAGQALDLLRKGPADLLAQAHVAKAAVLRLQGFLDRCVQECEQAIALLGEPQGKTARLTLAEAYHHRAAAYLQSGRFQEAVEALHRALPLYQAEGNLYRISYVYHNLGRACRALGEFGSAAAHYAQAQAGWRKLGNSSRLAATMNNLGNLYRSQGQLQLAEETLTQAAVVARESGANTVLSYVSATLGEVWRQRGQYQEALRCFEEGLIAARDTSEHKNQVQCTEGLALTYLALGDAGRAQVLIEGARGLAGSHSGTDILGRLLISQGVVLRSLGQWENAQEIMKQAIGVLEQGGAQDERARACFHLAEILWSQGEPGAGELLEQVEALLAEPGTETSLLSDARLVAPFVKYVASLKPEKQVFRRLLAALSTYKASPQVAPATCGEEGPAAPSVRAYSLGKSRVELVTPEVRVVQWPRVKAKELFFYLLLRGDWVLKEEIIETLWPEMSEAKGNTIFWTTAYRLRQGVFSDCLVRDDGYYRLNPQEAFWWDAQEFEEQVQTGCRASLEEEERIEKIQRALRLYQGPFLNEIYADWTVETRSRLQGRYLSALLILARIWLTRREFENAVDLCERALAVDPYQDDAYYLTMLAFASAGRAPEAYGAFRRYMRITTEELRTTPNQRVLELHQQILRGELLPSIPLTVS